MFVHWAVIATIPVVIIARMRVPGGVKSANLGWMSEQWLAEHRASYSRQELQSGCRRAFLRNARAVHLPFRRISLMEPSFSRRHATVVVLEDEQDIFRRATCPMCHTSATLSESALEGGGGWRCVRCGQRWDAERLAAVAAYAAWTVEHDRVGGRRTEGSPGAALYGDVPSERLGGRA